MIPLQYTFVAQQLSTKNDDGVMFQEYSLSGKILKNIALLLILYYTVQKLFKQF